MNKIWRPFTQEKTAEKPLKIVKGKGEYLFDEEGNKYLDMISSWWVNTLGHSNVEIANAINDQAHKLEHVIFAGFSHDMAERLVSKLSESLPKSLSKFFFSDNGSTSVEVALKISYQFFKNQEIKNKNIFINLNGAYHGDTIGAMSAAGNSSEYHSLFSEFFFKTFSIDFPQTQLDEEISIEKLNDFLKTHHNEVCALIIEPLVQGAAGMRMYSPKFLDTIVKTVRKYEILVIFDEVMTGFYRTGKMFAMDYCEETPDIICLSKGLTGGFLPLSLTITTDRIYEAFLSNDWKKAFIHGHSYTANPIACAAACEALEILKTTEIQNNINMISQTHMEFLNKNSIDSSRTLGTISAIDIKSETMAKTLTIEMLKQGVIIRPIKNTVYFIPPYCISKQNLDYAYECLLKIL